MKRKNGQKQLVKKRRGGDELNKRFALVENIGEREGLMNTNEMVEATRANESNAKEKQMMTS
jgi:hypothetical protein